MVFRRTENDPNEISEEFMLQKLNEIKSFQELLSTQIIKKKHFSMLNGKCPVLTIHTEKKKKEKRKKRKNSDSDLNSEAVQ